MDRSILTTRSDRARFFLSAMTCAVGLTSISSGAVAGEAAAPVVLPTVKVAAQQQDKRLSAPYAGGQVAQGGDLGLLGAADVMETPFSTVNYTALEIDESQAYMLTDVLTHDASVRATTSTEGFGDDFQIRGFAVGSGDMSLNGLYGLLSSSHIPMAMAARVDLLKGPGTLMRGIPPNGSIGGSANIVTKRAEATPLTQLTLGYRGAENATAKVDVGRRFGDEKAWGVRFNGVLRDGEATIKDGNQQLGLGTLGVDYRGERWRWSMDAIYQKYQLDSYRGQIRFAPNVTHIPTAPDGDVTIYPGAGLTQEDKTIATRLEYDLSDRVSAHLAMGYRDGEVGQTFPMSVNPLTGVREGVDAAGNFGVKNSYYDSYTKTFSSDAGIRGRFDTGEVGHTLSLGLSHLTEEAGNAFSAGSAISSSNLYNPSPLPANAAVRLDTHKAADTTLDSVALADTLALFDDRLLVTLGLRHQSVKVEGYSTLSGNKTSDYDASAVSPAAGVVVKLQENVSLYGNFTEGLTRGTIVGPAYANAGEVLDPYKSKQYELGVKTDWGEVTTTAAIFQLSHPAARADANNVYDYSGAQRNRGVELGAYGALRPGLRLLASAALIRAELRGTGNAATDGNRAAGVPEQSYRLGLDWDLPWVPQVSLSGRVNYTSDMYANDTNTLTLPAVTTLDVGAQYRARIASKQVVLRLNVSNLTDKNYWLSSNGMFATNAAGRTVKASATIDF